MYQRMSQGCDVSSTSGAHMQPGRERVSKPSRVVTKGCTFWQAEQYFVWRS